MIEHATFGIKLLIEGLTAEEPAWMVQEKDQMKHRVRQMKDLLNDEMVARMTDNNASPLLLVEEITKKAHSDPDLATMIVPKLHQGALDFERE